MAVIVEVEKELFSYRKMVYSFSMGRFFAKIEGSAKLKIEHSGTVQSLDVLVTTKEVGVVLSKHILNSTLSFKATTKGLSMNFSNEFININIEPDILNPISVSVPIDIYTINLKQEIPTLKLIGIAEVNCSIILDFLPNYRAILRTARYAATKGRGIIQNSKKASVEATKKFIKFTINFGRRVLHEIWGILKIPSAVRYGYRIMNGKYPIKLPQISSLLRLAGRALGGLLYFLDIKYTAEKYVSAEIARIHKESYEEVKKYFRNGYCFTLAAIVQKSSIFLEVELEAPTISPEPKDVYSYFETGDRRKLSDSKKGFDSKFREKDFIVSLNKELAISMDAENLFKQSYNIFFGANNLEFATKLFVRKTAIRLGELSGEVTAIKDILAYLIASSDFRDKTDIAPDTSQLLNIKDLHDHLFGQSGDEKYFKYLTLIDDDLTNLIPPFEGAFSSR